MSLSQLPILCQAQLVTGAWTGPAPASSRRGTSERIMRSFSQSGSSRASSDVSTRKAVGRGCFSGNQMPNRAWNSSSPASGKTAGEQGCPGCQQQPLLPRKRLGVARPRPSFGEVLPSRASCPFGALHSGTTHGPQQGWIPSPLFRRPRGREGGQPAAVSSKSHGQDLGLAGKPPAWGSRTEHDPPLGSSGNDLPHLTLLPAHRALQPPGLPPPHSQPLTAGGAERQKDDHGVNHKDVHGGRLPTAPAQEHLVLGLGLQGKGPG